MAGQVKIYSGQAEFYFSKGLKFVENILYFETIKDKRKTYIVFRKLLCYLCSKN